MRAPADVKFTSAPCADSYKTPRSARHRVYVPSGAPRSQALRLRPRLGAAALSQSGTLSCLPTRRPIPRALPSPTLAAPSTGSGSGGVTPKQVCAGLKAVHNVLALGAYPMDKGSAAATVLGAAADATFELGDILRG